MKRRDFLSVLGLLGFGPLVPADATPEAEAAEYGGEAWVDAMIRRRPHNPVNPPGVEDLGLALMVARAAAEDVADSHAGACVCSFCEEAKHLAYLLDIFADLFTGSVRSSDRWLDMRAAFRTWRANRPEVTEEYHTDESYF